MLPLVFQRGARERPLGHAIVYFRANDGSVYATYIVVLPIKVNISKYIPQIFAANLGDAGADSLEAIPWPPIPEKVESEAYLEALADRRGDDLIFAGAADASHPESLLRLTSESSHDYSELYNNSQTVLPDEGGRSSLSRADAGGDSANAGGNTSMGYDVEEILMSLMSDGDRLTELVKLTGKLRDIVDRGTPREADETAADLERVTRHFPEKYRLKDYSKIARTPGERARKLSELLIERSYLVLREEYGALAAIDQKIAALSK